MTYSIIRQERNKFSVAGSHKYNETDSINSVQSSSFVGNPLLYFTPESSVIY